MRAGRAILLVAMAALLLWSLGAKNDANIKIGVVDLDQAVTATTEGREAREEFERKKRKAEDQLMPLVERFQTLLKELEDKRFVLSDDKLRDKQLDLAELRNEIESKRAEMEGRLEVDRERLVGPLRQKLVSIIEEVGREDGFSLIMLRNAPGIMYSREALDITDVVIEHFNKKS